MEIDYLWVWIILFLVLIGTILLAINESIKDYPKPVEEEPIKYRYYLECENLNETHALIRMPPVVLVCKPNVSEAVERAVKYLSDDLKEFYRSQIYERVKNNPCKIYISDHYYMLNTCEIDGYYFDWSPLVAFSDRIEFNLLSDNIFWKEVVEK